MDDVIRRQAAIDTLADMYCKSDEDGYVWIIRSDAWARIDALPSAQSEIIRCEDCKHRYEDECPMHHVEWVEYDDDGYIDSDDVIYDYTEDDGYCFKAERRTG